MSYFYGVGSIHIGRDVDYPGKPTFCDSFVPCFHSFPVAYSVNAVVFRKSNMPCGSEQSQQHVLVLGAGLMARPLVRYFLDENFFVTVASRTLERAKNMCPTGGHSSFRCFQLDMEHPEG